MIKESVIKVSFLGNQNQSSTSALCHFDFSHWRLIFKHPQAELIAALNLKTVAVGVCSLSVRDFC